MIRSAKILLAIVVLIVPVIGCLRSPDSFYFGNYSEAEKLYNDGKYAEAITKYQAFIDENPEGNLAVISTYYIAKSQLQLEKIPEAKELLTQIVANHPDTVWANFSQTQLKELS